MEERRYFRCNISELEDLFERSKHNSVVLNELKRELRHRVKPRERTLAGKVADHILSLARGGMGVSAAGAFSVDEQPALPVVVDPASAARSQEVNDTAPRFARDATTESGLDAVLAAWLAQEVLTPQALPTAREWAADKCTLVRLRDSHEPWLDRKYRQRGEETAVYWLVYLGELPLAKAMAGIHALYPEDTQGERSAVDGHTALALVVVDAKGIPVAGKSSVSSFAWGYGQLRAGRLKELAHFADAEKRIAAELERRILRQDRKEGRQPLTVADLRSVTAWLGKLLNVPEADVTLPGVAMRMPRFGINSDAPAAEHLNSCFIADLTNARQWFRAGQAGRALAAYLGARPAKPGHDRPQHPEDLAASLAPARTPASRWPGPGRVPLAPMKQAAVNHAIAALTDGGLVTVHAPSGTGKTALLRDIVAHVVLQRAKALATFDQPAEAFTLLGSTQAGAASADVYILANNLLGYEIVFAAADYPTVESLGRELSAAGALADDLQSQARYFSSLSDTVAAGDNAIVAGATWGLAAAALGKPADGHVFTRSYFWHQQRGMAHYLKAIAEPPEQTATLDILALEQAPRGEAEALERWRGARRRFLDQLQHVEELQEKMQGVHDAMGKVPDARQRVDTAENTLQVARTAHAKAVEKEKSAKDILAGAVETERKASDDLDAFDRSRPGLLARSLGTDDYARWQSQKDAAQATLARARGRLNLALKSAHRVAMEAGATGDQVRKSERELEQASDALQSCLLAIETMRPELGASLPDEVFGQRADSHRQPRAPWQHPAWQDARDQLFVATFALHRAFIDAAARPLRHNLLNATALLTGGALPVKLEAARRSLWASLFLTVPVIATTFAAISRLFGPLGREQTGWLLIADAGQAVPQAAVGAIMRARNAIIFGDPSQTPPGVTTPSKHVRSIFAEFDTPVEQWAGPQTSVQSLADRASGFGTTIESDRFEKDKHNQESG